MRTFEVRADLPADAKGASVALGNFDGLHAGHRAVIENAHIAARELGAPLAVATFEPAPRRVFQPDAPPFRLMTPRRRELALEALGVDLCLLLHFDRAMANLTDRGFCERVLRGQLGARSVSIGFDFRFGHDRVGDAASLVRLGGELGFAGRVVAEVAHGGEKASSSAIRQMIERGDMAGAGKALGGCWITDAAVEHGEKRGRTLGFPTANLQLGEIVHPAHGVYAVWSRLEEESAWSPGVASFGRTPTTGLRDPLLEVVRFDWQGDIYGKRLHVAFADFLRPEVKFPSLEALVQQMKADAAKARERLSRLSPPNL